MINILSGGFNGKLYPINPSSDTILGLKCYKNILDIDFPIDLVVIEECGRKGVKAAVIISARFKETGEQGKILEDKVKRVAKDYEMRLIGPNCIGFINTDPKECQSLVTSHLFLRVVQFVLQCWNMLK
jgi:acyl-CoA synthetase (NDP forming)